MTVHVTGSSHSRGHARRDESARFLVLPGAAAERLALLVQRLLGSAEARAALGTDHRDHSALVELASALAQPGLPFGKGG